MEMVMVVVAMVSGAFWFWENDPSGPIGTCGWVQAVGVGLMFLGGGLLWLRRGRQGLIR
jgi:hypothetical protein